MCGTPQDIARIVRSPSWHQIARRKRMCVTTASYQITTMPMESTHWTDEMRSGDARESEFRDAFQMIKFAAGKRSAFTHITYIIM